MKASWQNRNLGLLQEILYIDRNAKKMLEKQEILCAQRF